jgi:Icc-related predicted phosphoesterase
MTTRHITQVINEQQNTIHKKLSFVVLSDTHNHHDRIFDNIIPGDVLIVTGDFTKRGTLIELGNFNTFLGQVKLKYGFKYIVLIAGNHDINLDPRFNPSIEESIGTLLSNVTHYLCNSFVIIEGIKIYGTPYTNCRGAYGSSNLNSVWELIPDDTDVVLTHCPPKNILDLAWVPKQESSDVCDICHKSHKYYEHWGSDTLKHHILNRVKPKLHIFGHVHDHYGDVKIDGTQFINSALEWSPMHEPYSFDYYVSQQEYQQRLSDTTYQFDTVYNVTQSSTPTVFKIVSKHDPNLVIEANEEQTRIKVAPIKHESDSNQRWTFTSEGYIELYGTDKVVDIDRANTSKGAKLCLWEKLGKKNQLWRIEGSTIVSLMNGYALDINTDKQPLSEIIVYPIHNHKNQQWSFQKL